MPGVATLEAEVTNISAHGLWLLLDNKELPVPYANFPWFKTATLEQIATLERLTENHQYWPRLDMDLTRESLRFPGTFPLVSGSKRYAKFRTQADAASWRGLIQVLDLQGGNRVWPQKKQLAHHASRKT